MTQRLQSAIKLIESLPECDQDGIADLIIAEVEDERKWDESFSKSKGQWAKVSAKVDADIQAGRVSPIGIDQL